MVEERNLGIRFRERQREREPIKPGQPFVSPKPEFVSCRRPNPMQFSWPEQKLTQHKMQNKINMNTKHTHLHDEINIKQIVETQLKVKKKKLEGKKTMSTSIGDSKKYLSYDIIYYFIYFTNSFYNLLYISIFIFTYISLK